MRNRTIIAGAVLMGIALLFIAAGAIPVRHGQQVVIFETPAFLIVVGLAAMAMLAACFQRRSPLRHIAFILSHAGFVLLMAGAWIDWRGGQRLDGIRLPVAMGHAVSKLHDASGEAVELGFAMAVTDFQVSFYDPVYSLLQPDPRQALTSNVYMLVRNVDPRVPSTLRHIPGGDLTVTSLKPHGEWLPEVVLTNGWVLRRQSETPSKFEAHVQTTVDGVVSSRILEVNHPLSAKGWQVLLVSYGNEPMNYVELAFRRSPGRRLVVAGIWSVIIGVSLLCFARPLTQEPCNAAS